MKKKLVATVLTAAMAASVFAGCGSSSSSTSTAASSSAAEEEATSEAAEEEATSEEAEEETTEAAAATDGDTPTIAFVPKVMGQAWWDYVQTCVEDWSTETGMDVIYKGPTEVDAAAQVQIMTDLVNQGVDILCFSPNDPDACEQICKDAMDKGIIVIATEASGMTNVDFDVEAFDETGLGAFMMDELAAQMGEEGQYVTMVGSLTMESHNNWADAAIARQEEAYPNLEYLNERLVSNSDSEEAYNQTKQILQKYPDLKGILGTSSFDAPGAARAIEELGLSGQVFAISVALPSEVSDYLESGTLQSVALWDPGISAKVMLNAAVKMFNGEEITEGTDLGEEGYESVRIDGTVIVGDGQIAITKDNYQDYSFA